MHGALSDGSRFSLDFFTVSLKTAAWCETHSCRRCTTLKNGDKQNATPQKRSRGQEEATIFSFLCSFQIVYQEEPCILLPHKTAAEIYLLSSSFYVRTSASPGILCPTPNLYINV